jgi:glycosyltransferase involved in cell wall biosynthesis
VVAEAYRRADVVLSISDDTTATTQLLYPFLNARQLMRLTLSVPTMFTPGTKERLITYMPRKLPAHAQRVRLYLEQRLPRAWRLHAIDNMGEEQVAATLARSCVFLSFSELEGYGLPPLEAALAGNLVVGYTGQGGREFFAPPIFRTVQNGDFLRYVAEVECAIADIESGELGTAALEEQRRRLATNHSVARETDQINKFISRVRTLMEPARAGTSWSSADGGQTPLSSVG